MTTIHEIPDHPQFGMRVVVCTNSECVAGTPSGHDCGSWADEATGTAESAADSACEKLLGWHADSDSNFHNWNGGRYYGGRPDINAGHVVANIYHRDPLDCPDELEDGEEVAYDDWSWCGKKALPADALAKAVEIVNAISEAHEAALVKAEAEYATA